MKKIIFAILLSLFLLVSCSNSEQILKVAISQEPGNLDAQRNSAQAVRMIAVTNIYEKLVTINKSGLAVLELASKYYISDDAKSIVFNLRENIKFHNGKNMKAEDVVASMNRWIEGYHAAEMIVGEARFEIVDDYTVKIVGEKPLILLIDVMAYSPQAAVIMPKEVAENLTEDGQIKEYIGTGVYKFSQWIKGDYIELVKFDGYIPIGGYDIYGLSGRKQGKIETIRYYFEPDSVLRTEQFENGDYHFISSADYDEEERLKGISNLHMTTSYEEGSLSLIFNIKSPISHDIAFRTAVNTGLDCEAIMEAAIGETGYVLHPNYMESHSKKWMVDGLDEYYNNNDKEKAKEILATSSYKGETVKILSPNLSEIRNGAYALQEDLAKMGITSSVEIVNWETFVILREDVSEYDIFLTPLMSVPIPSLKQFLCSEYPGWTNDEYLASLIHAFNESTDKNEQQEIWSTIHHYCYEYLPAISIGHYQTINLWSDKIENVYTDFGFYFWNANFKKR